MILTPPEGTESAKNYDIKHCNKTTFIHLHSATIGGQRSKFAGVLTVSPALATPRIARYRQGHNSP
jgi:hypothetical protein